MRYVLKPLILTLIILLFSISVYGSNNNVEITFIGNETLLIKNKDITILTDPYFTDHFYALCKIKRQIPCSMTVSDLPKIDLILVTHNHPDHFDVDAIKKLPNKPTIVVPWNEGKELKQLGFPVINLHRWEVYNQGGVKITAVPARHTTIPCLGYIIEIDGKKLYLAGDTKLFKDLPKLQKENIDIMFMPYGGMPILGTVWTTAGAVKAVQIVKPKMVIPVHWEILWRSFIKEDYKSPESFCREIKKKAPVTKCIILQNGEKLNLG